MNNNKINKHEISATSVNLSDYMKKIALDVSETFGGNGNNQITMSHGIQVLLLRWQSHFTTDVLKKYYPKIDYILDE